MKFQIPIVKPIVTADGPACFDIAGDTNDIQNRRGIFYMDAACECKVQFLPCDCKCECLCMCECVCRCECVCVCRRLDRADKFNESLIDDFNYGRIRLNECLMYRKEKFGGIIFDKTDFTSYLCNKSAWEIFQYISDQREVELEQINEISNRFCEKYQNVPDNIGLIIESFICGCLKNPNKFLSRDI